jgi:hypothetical protein
MQHQRLTPGVQRREDGVAGAIAGFFTVSRVWGNVPGGMIFDFVNKNNLL